MSDKPSDAQIEAEGKFQAIKQALQHGRLGRIEAFDQRTGEKVELVCIMQQRGSTVNFDALPVAKILLGEEYKNFDSELPKKSSEVQDSD